MLSRLSTFGKSNRATGICGTSNSTRSKTSRIPASDTALSLAAFPRTRESSVLHGTTLGPRSAGTTAELGEGATMLGNVIGVLFDGVAYGSLLFIISIGLSVTMGLMNFVNLAH